jgi:HSP20 family protein
MSDIRDSFEDFFNRSLFRRFRGRGLFEAENHSPKISVSEEGENVIVEAELPGIEKKDINLSVTNDLVTIKGETKKEKKEEKKGRYYYNERYYGSFYRSIELPKEVDDKKAKASFKDGILKIELPVSKEAKTKEMKVAIE